VNFYCIINFNAKELNDTEIKTKQDDKKLISK